MSNMKKAFNTAERGVASAFNKWDSAQGIPNDPMERTYENLKPQDIASLINRFGIDNVAKYIKVMETKRIKRRGG